GNDKAIVLKIPFNIRPEIPLRNRTWTGGGVLCSYFHVVNIVGFNKPELISSQRVSASVHPGELRNLAKSCGDNSSFGKGLRGIPGVTHRLCCAQMAHPRSRNVIQTQV